MPGLPLPHVQAGRQVTDSSGALHAAPVSQELAFEVKPEGGLREGHLNRMSGTSQSAVTAIWEAEAGG